MIGVRNARDTLQAGFTSVRDVGNYRAFVDVALRDAIDAGWTPGSADDGAPAPSSAAAEVAATSAAWRPTPRSTCRRSCGWAWSTPSTT